MAVFPSPLFSDFKGLPSSPRKNLLALLVKTHANALLKADVPNQTRTQQKPFSYLFVPSSPSTNNCMGERPQSRRKVGRNTKCTAPV